MFGTEQCDEIGSTLNPCLTLKENCVYQVSPRNPSRKALLHFIQRDECDKNTQTVASLSHCCSFSDFCPKVCKVLLHT